MNYLGHFYLAYPNEDLLVGNLLGDTVKGCSYEYYPKPVADGILMHRKIDDFTDRHELSAKCRTILRPVAGKFAGVALDILYDHVLAKNWKLFSATPALRSLEVSLEKFTQDVYRILNTRYKELAMENRIMLGYMERENWLLRYATKDGTQKSLKGMSQRIAYKNNLDSVMTIYEEHENEFDKLALEFLNAITKSLKP